MAGTEQAYAGGVGASGPPRDRARGPDAADPAHPAAMTTVSAHPAPNPIRPALTFRPTDGHGSPGGRLRSSWSAVIALVVYALTDTSDPLERGAPGHRLATAWWPRSPNSRRRSSTPSGSTRPATPLVAALRARGSARRCTSAGKPEVLFVGAEFCPFCARRAMAADRGAVPVRPLHRTSPTCSRRRSRCSPTSRPSVSWGRPTPAATCASPGSSCTRTPSNAQGTFARIATLTPAQTALWPATAPRPGTDGHRGRYPFVDIGNRMVTSTSGFSPAVLRQVSPRRPSPAR